MPSGGGLVTPRGLAPATRCLVTGGAGFLGANLCRALSGAHAVVRPGGRPWRLPALPAGARLHPVDLRDAAAVRRLLRVVRPQVVFHAAAHSAYDGASLGENARDDLSALAQLLDALIELRETYRAPVERVVVLGSSLAYGPADRPHREDERLRPASARGAFRAAASDLALGVARAARLPLVELRLFSVYGPWEPLHRLVPRAIRASFGGEELPLTAPGAEGGPRRDLVFVADAVEACLLAAAAPGIDGLAINVGSGTEVSNQEIVQAVERAVGRPVRALPGAYPRHGTDTAHWRADVSRAEELLGWRPRHGLAEGLSVTVDWLREGLAAGGDDWVREGERR